MTLLNLLEVQKIIPIPKGDGIELIAETVKRLLKDIKPKEPLSKDVFVPVSSAKIQSALPAYTFKMI